MGTRASAIGRALEFFDGPGFRDRLAELVAIPRTSQDPGHETDVQRYLEAPSDRGSSGWASSWRFMPIRSRIRPDPSAQRIEDPHCRPCSTYGHGEPSAGWRTNGATGSRPGR